MQTIFLLLLGSCIFIFGLYTDLVPSCTNTKSKEEKYRKMKLKFFAALTLVLFVIATFTPSVRAQESEGEPQDTAYAPEMALPFSEVKTLSSTTRDYSCSDIEVISPFVFDIVCTDGVYRSINNSNLVRVWPPSNSNVNSNFRNITSSNGVVHVVGWRTEASGVVNAEIFDNKDLGTTWPYRISTDTAGKRLSVIEFADSNRGVAIGRGTTSAIEGYYSTNNGKNWTAVDVTSSTTSTFGNQLGAASQVDGRGDVSYLFATAGTQLCLSNSGASWACGAQGGGEASANGIYLTSVSNLHLVGNVGDLGWYRRSTTGGLSWSGRLWTSTNNPYNYIHFVPTRSDIGYIAAGSLRGDFSLSSGEILETLDGGTNFSRQTIANTSIVACDSALYNGGAQARVYCLGLRYAPGPTGRLGVVVFAKNTDQFPLN